MSNKRRVNTKPAFNDHFELQKISALTDNQALVLGVPGNKVLSGSAGTGKTFLACEQGLREVLSGKKDRLIIIRSTVATRDIGHLPGDEDAKVAVYERPYPPIINDLLGRGDAYSILKKKILIDFESTSFLRGTTFNHSFILVDEIQNMSFHELDTVVSRVGKNCTIVLCGDYKQADLKDSGLKKFLAVIGTMKNILHVQFTRDDIVRGDFVKEYIIAKEIYEEGGSK